ncbi:zinc-finger homeodomain protein 6-like [Malus sylvestris]|uniref:zinc-finger homeodomain protein 6-like n=1 Tax=Malus sylvestris TaxID=3752 RepID=UPI0021ABDD29|nr:zinc-finger homeodomain protein 6-like [Malus sylvestris]
MELRGQDKVIGRMPSTLTYTPPPRRDSSSSKLSSSPDFPSAGHHGNNTTLFTHPPHQTLDRSRRDPDPTPVLVTPSAATTIASGSNFKAPPAPPQPQPSTAASRVRYRECLKNHAVSSGGHVLDGCGEFMPGGDEDTPGSLKCAACECHRNFHRKEIDGDHVSNNYYVINQQHNSRRDSAITRLPVLISTPPSLPVHHSAARGPSPAMMMTFGSSGGVAAESSSEDLNMNNNLFGGANYAADAQGSKKRFRTKFSQEQKEKMTEVAEKLGWRIQKHDEQEVEKLCSEVGIKRQVFKVWMHNNKQAMKKKQM